MRVEINYVGNFKLNVSFCFHHATSCFKRIALTILLLVSVVQWEPKAISYSQQWVSNDNWTFSMKLRLNSSAIFKSKFVTLSWNGNCIWHAYVWRELCSPPSFDSSNQNLSTIFFNEHPIRVKHSLWSDYLHIEFASDRSSLFSLMAEFPSGSNILHDSILQRFCSIQNINHHFIWLSNITLQKNDSNDIAIHLSVSFQLRIATHSSSWTSLYWRTLLMTHLFAFSSKLKSNIVS